MLNKPSLYLSAHLEKHRGAYYDALTRVRESNDIGPWVRFFFQAVIETAENARQMIMYLYGAPTITVNKAMELLGIKYVPANSLIAALVDMSILQEITGYQRNRIFILRRYMNIFQDGN